MGGGAAGITGVTAGAGLSGGGTDGAVSLAVKTANGLEIVNDNVVVKLDGSTLSRSNAGVKVADGGIGPTQLDAGTDAKKTSLRTAIDAGKDPLNFFDSGSLEDDAQRTVQDTDAIQGPAVTEAGVIEYEDISGFGRVYETKQALKWLRFDYTFNATQGVAFRLRYSDAKPTASTDAKTYGTQVRQVNPNTAADSELFDQPGGRFFFFTLSGGGSRVVNMRDLRVRAMYTVSVSAEVADGGVTTAKLADGAVTGPKLGADVPGDGLEIASNKLRVKLDGATLTRGTDGVAVANPFTTDDEAKLDGIESNATADQTGAEMVTALSGLSGSARLPYSAVRDGPPAGAEANVQSDWNATSGDAFIKNKPAIPAAPGNASTTARGLIEILTEAEADAGTDTERAVTAALLKRRVEAAFPVVSDSTARAVSASDMRKLLRLTGSTARTWTLPDVTGGVEHGKFLFVENASTAVLTLDPNASDTIDGSATLDIPAGELRLILVTSTTTWKSVGGGGGAALSDAAILDLAKGTRTSADRGKPLGTSTTDENALALLDSAQPLVQVLNVTTLSTNWAALSQSPTAYDDDSVFEARLVGLADNNRRIVTARFRLGDLDTNAWWLPWGAGAAAGFRAEFRRSAANTLQYRKQPSTFSTFRLRLFLVDESLVRGPKGDKGDDGATPGDASDTAKGVVELATAAETQAGTDTARAVTPAGLAALTATETRDGLIEIATNTEADTGTDTTRAMTPATVKRRIEAQPRDRGAWASGTSYIVGDTATEAGNVYRCKTPNSDTTFTASKWDNLTAAAGGGADTTARAAANAALYAGPFRHLIENQNTVAVGIASDGDDMIVVDWTALKAFFYDFKSKEPDSTKDIAFGTLAANHNSAWDIAVHGDEVLIPDYNARMIYRYNKTAKTWKGSSSTIDLSTVYSATQQLNGIATDGTTIWTFGRNNTTFRASTYATGARDSTKDISGALYTPSPGIHHYPTALTYHDGKLYALYPTYGIIRAFDTTSKAADSTLDFDWSHGYGMQVVYGLWRDDYHWYLTSNPSFGADRVVCFDATTGFQVLSPESPGFGQTLADIEAASATTSVTLTHRDRGKLISADTSAGERTRTLPATLGAAGEGFTVTVEATDARNVCRVRPGDSSWTIDGESEIVLAGKYARATFAFSAGAPNWRVLSRVPPQPVLVARSADLATTRSSGDKLTAWTVQTGIPSGYSNSSGQLQTPRLMPAGYSAYEFRAFRNPSGVVTEYSRARVPTGWAGQLSGTDLEGYVALYFENGRRDVLVKYRPSAGSDSGSGSNPEFWLYDATGQQSYSADSYVECWLVP